MPVDTIYALSSAAGRAGVAVIRISGPQALEAWFELAGTSALPVPRKAQLRRLVDRGTGMFIDQALVLWFPAGGSFTGEPVLELQVHGGRAVIKAVFDVLRRIKGFRLAQAGEFSRRAFEGGKLDLVQVEAVGALIDAETEQQRRQALRGLEGDLGERVRGWRAQLLALRGLIAAAIDFSDEGDVGHSASPEIDSLLEQLHSEMTGVRAAGDKGRIVSEGFSVAIVGAPNSGKSSLLNALAGYEAAIVTEHAGTTRDLVQVKLDLGGYVVLMTDTAGLRDTDEPVEHIGIGRALSFARNADLVLHLDADGQWDRVALDVDPERLIRIRSKSDLLNDSELTGATLALSSRSIEGLGSLRARLIDELAKFDSEPSLVINQRQQEALDAALLALSRCRALPADDIELRDHEVRAAESELDFLVGRLGVEEVLGSVFARFCVGK